MLKCLEFPLDTATIMQKKKALKKLLLSNSELVDKRIAILGGSTCAEVRNILELFLLKVGIRATFYESEYNQYYEAAVFENPELKKFNPDVVYIHTTQKNIQNYPSAQNTEAETELLFQNELQRFKQIWDQIEQKYQCTIIQNNFECPQMRNLGNLDTCLPQGKIHFVNQLNQAFVEQARGRKNLILHDIHFLAAQLGGWKWFDPQFWYSYKYALSFEAIPYLCNSLAAILSALFGKSKKVLVLDLDHTLWGGVIGDDGLEGIQLGPETPEGEAFADFQRYVKNLSHRGVALAVCSKNEEALAESGFKHPHSILKRDDFVSFKANWESKDLNIQKIVSEINVGEDSVVFVDDNPAEREIVRQQLKFIEVPEVNEDVTLYWKMLEFRGYFESVSFSRDDLKRTVYLKENQKRLKQQSNFKDYSEYLKSLKMSAEIGAFSSIYLERITQLVNKTNQFNLTTKRMTLAEIEGRMNNSEKYLNLYARLKDKFGDNGLITVFSGELRKDELHVDLWLMSCRVLKREMEKAFLDEIVRRSKILKIKKIVGYYYPTLKNKLVAKLYSELGFHLLGEDTRGTTWELTLENYCNQNQNIEVAYVK